MDLFDIFQQYQIKKTIQNHQNEPDKFNVKQRITKLI